MKEKVLGLKEFVIVLLLACVETAIAIVVAMPFAANLQLCVRVLRNPCCCKRTDYAGRRVSGQNPSCHPSCAYMDAQRNGQHADSAAVP